MIGQNKPSEDFKPTRQTKMFQESRIKIARELVKIARMLVVAKGKVADKFGLYNGFTGKIVHPTIKKCFGYVYNGIFSIDEDGILFKGGTWKDGAFFGEFLGGTFSGGWFRDGKFDGGIWEKGDWQKGDWIGGFDKHGQWHQKDPKHFLEEKIIYSPDDISKKDKEREERYLKKEEDSKRFREQVRKERDEQRNMRQLKFFNIYQAQYVTQAFGTPQNSRNNERLKASGFKKIGGFESRDTEQEKIDGAKKILKREGNKLGIAISEIDSFYFESSPAKDGDLFIFERKGGKLLFVVRKE